MLSVMYRRARGRVAELASTVGDDRAAAPVPATPEWTIRELLAHVVGVAADVSAGRMDGAPGDEWTARQVQERRGRSVGELLAEWDRVAPAVERGLPEGPMAGPNPVADLLCHEADLREALALAPVDREHWQPLLEVSMESERKRFRHSPTLLIRDELGQQWCCGSGEPSTLVRADGYELVRAAFSRRSRRQIAAWNWTPGPVEQIVDRFGFFGARDDDQPVPR